MTENMASMKDVAAHAGVSVATVSNVETGKKYVSPEVTKRVKDSMKALGYHVNLVARGLKSNHTNVVGVILPDIARMFFPDVLKGIQDTAKKHKYTIHFLTSDYDFSQEKKMVQNLRGSRVDGIIIDSCCADIDRLNWAQDLSKNSNEKKCPIVSLEQELDENLVSCVRIHNRSAQKKCIDHLIELGARKIVFIRGLDNIVISVARLKGYRDSMNEAGLEVSEDLIIQGEFRFSTAYYEIRKLIGRGIQFDAVAASNDQAALGALKALTEAKIKVPQDVMVTGFDNLPISELSTPQLTTICVPRYDMGRRAFEIVYELIMNGEGPISDTLDNKLLIRNSTVATSETIIETSTW